MPSKLSRRIPKIQRVSRMLRKNQTRPERVLWSKLRARRFHGYKFRRQAPIGSYVVDFYCHSQKLIIEIDGHDHDRKKEHDAYRELMLRRAGLHIIRFTNRQVVHSLSWVLSELEKTLPSP